MKIINLSNYFNHHQKPLSDALYHILGNDYWFVETTSVPGFRKNLGYQELTAPYLIRYCSETKERISRMIMDADVVIYGEAPLRIIKARYNSNKLTLRDDESRYKNPNRYLKWPVYTFKSLWLNRGYLLCASAFAPIDYFLSGMKKKKCFRWGYFTELEKYDTEVLMAKKKSETPEGVSILWVGRLIKLKHPESTIRVAEHLKEQGVLFTLNIIGSGLLESKLKKTVNLKGLSNVIHFLGPMTPADVRKQMEKAEIFLFTSDRQEGWGAVLNESMNSGCAVVADCNIGSVPYLIKDGVNGFIYKSSNWKDLCSKVEWLARHPKEMTAMGRKAYQTMAEIWNAETAAENLLVLCESLSKGGICPVSEGPCSQAPLLMRKWKGLYNTL